MMAFVAFILLLVAPGLALYRLAPSVDWPWSTGAIVIVSAIAYGLYAHDKRRARAEGWRVSEATLHLVEALGGWPGAFIAQRVIRHKTRKASYQVSYWLIVVVYQYIAIDFVLGWPAARAALRVFDT